MEESQPAQQQRYGQPRTTIEKPTTAKVTTTISTRKGSVERERQSETKRAAHANFASAAVNNQVTLCGLGCPVRFRLAAGRAGDAPHWRFETGGAKIEMTKRSAGILLFRRIHGSAQVLLIHPGGPYWRRKDEGAWSIPKGLFGEGEEPLLAAKREFLEETGMTPQGVFIELGEFRQPSGKRLSVWALEGDFDLDSFKSNTFRMEWPPSSDRFEDFPEADRAEWFDAENAARKITKGQRPILDALLRLLSSAPRSQT